MSEDNMIIWNYELSYEVVASNRKLAGCCHGRAFESGHRHQSVALVGEALVGVDIALVGVAFEESNRDLTAPRFARRFAFES